MTMMILWLVIFACGWAMGVLCTVLVQRYLAGRNKVDAEWLPKNEPMAPPKSPMPSAPWLSPFAPKKKPMRSVTRPESESNRLQPHHYRPSTLHMGDCDICGHLQHSPMHLQSPPLAEPRSFAPKPRSTSWTPKPKPKPVEPPGKPVEPPPLPPAAQKQERPTTSRLLPTNDWNPKNVR